MYDKELFKAYRCPKWEEWPDFGLYMDQVVSLIEERVSIFYPDEKAGHVTPTMINNYVKQHIVSPTKNKKYDRVQLSCLYLIFLLKPVFGLGDISKVLRHLESYEDFSEGYNAFCAQTEAALGFVFSNERDSEATDEILKAYSLSYAYTLYARALTE